MTISFARHQFPPAIIRHAVWLYVRFTLSYRDVEDLLAERGLDVSYETVRRWVFIDGPINGESFAAHVEQVLVPTLKEDDIVVLDNLGSHKGAAIRRMIRAAGARVFFLPPYSPDLNPIEQVFAKLKHKMREAAERTVEDTWRRLGALLPTFSAKECANYLKNSGYAAICKQHAHPTVKPTAMLDDALLDVTNLGDIAIDPFLGSGSGLIAAQNTGRMCRGVELDPLYITVIMRRFEAATGNQAILVETGEAFEALAGRRALEPALA